MYKLCKSEQSARRQRELELGLLEAMQTQLYEDISISELCDRMGIPRKSFYRYFSNKDGALMALLDHTLMEYEQTGNGISGTGIIHVGALEQYFRFWYERRPLLEALMRSRLSGMLVERATQHAMHERLMPRYLVNQDPGTQQMALTFAICGLLSMVMQWQQSGYRETPEQMAQIASMMLTKPLVFGRN